VSGAAEDLDIRDITDRWPVTSSAVLGDGSLVRLRRDLVRMPGDGDAVARDILEHPGAVAVLALDEAGRVLLIRQYRHPVGRQLWEIPAGLRDVAGEPTLVTAQRELLEEAGYRAAGWHVLVDFFPSPGISTERVRIFCARGLNEVPESERSFVPVHEEAHLLVAWVDLDELVAKVLAGDLHNGVTALGILSAYAARQGGFTALRDAEAPEC
jgi:ADP-ribose pyrophosphatase